jgi:ankyrin repeat protein
MSMLIFRALQRASRNETEIEAAERVASVLSVDPKAANQPDGRGEVPIHFAACAKQPAVIRLLLQYGANVNARGWNQLTPLHYATHGRMEDIQTVLMTIRVLLEAGADPNLTDDNGNTPLFGAGRLIGAVRLKGDDYEAPMLQLLLDFGADPLIRNKRLASALHSISTIAGARLLIARGLSVNERDIDGFTLIMKVLDGTGRYEVVDYLCSQGADLTVVDKNGDSLLHHACRETTGGLSVLLRYRVDLNVQNREGRTPLHQATCSHNYDGIKLLLQAGADRTIRDAEGMTALDLAKAGVYCGTNPYYAPPPYGEKMNPRSFRATQASIVRLLSGFGKLGN